ncbi:MAG: arylsulfatase A-like enzyme [Candidatus Paceibacteria bacterium]|jgi:arylsulfatase A-like enzyme
MSRHIRHLLLALGPLFWGVIHGACSPVGSGSEAGTADSSEIAAVLSDAEPKHVLLIVIDTLRADHMSCYGYWRETSPHMDALAAKGVRFERALSQSSWTSPSMVTMMTGHRLSSRRLNLPQSKPTLAELFKDAGFATGAFVTNDLLSPLNGFDRGFDSWTMDKNGLNKLGVVTQWIHDQRDQDTFTWVHFTDPHDPYKPPPSTKSEQLGRFSDSTEELMRSAVATGLYGGLENQRTQIAQEIGRYDDEVMAVDRKVQQLLDVLEETGRMDNSIVVITSDHGECLWQRLESDSQVEHQAKVRSEKQGDGAKTRLKHRLKQTHGTFVFQELVRVPLIISAPGLERGLVVNQVAESVHLASTILRLAGVDVGDSPAMVGRNLFGSDLPGGGYTMTDQGEAFLDEDGWKLILPTEVGRSVYGILLQLYHLGQDPEELNNLAQEEEGQVQRLKKLIEARRRQALLPETGETWEEVMRKNAEALRGNGYLEGGFLDGPTGEN